MENTSLWNIALNLLALAGGVAAQDPTVSCSATNARLNLTRDLKSGTDYVPVVDDDSMGFNVVYSIKSDNSFTVGIFILPLYNDDVLIFGAGYGENSLDGKQDEAAAVDLTIQGCMGGSPATTTIHFAAPHGHLDHINPPFIEEMMTLGYSFAEITYHEDDALWIDEMDWGPGRRSLFREWRGGQCGDNLAEYDSPLGKIWFTPRPGHTAGSIDLILDVLDEPTNRLMIRGSVAGGLCNAVPGVQVSIDAHGTVFLPPEEGIARARAEVVNGTGINQLCLTTDSAPRLGGRWQAMIEPSGHVGARGLILTAYSAPLDPGIMSPYGEYLLDSQTGLMLMSLAQPARSPTFTLDVPVDMTYLGYEAWFQGLIVSGTAELCNALHVQIGF